MTVPVNKEPDDVFPGCNNIQERCCLCRTPTRFWYTPKDVALCEPCAALPTTTPETLPTKREWCDKERALTPRGFHERY